MTVIQVFLDTTDKGLKEAEDCGRGGEGCRQVAQQVARHVENYILKTEGDTQRVDLHHHLTC